MPEGDAPSGTAADNSKLVAHLERKNADLERDNKKYRDRLKEARDELAKAKPADGTVVLTAEEAKRWEALQKIEGDPADIAKRLERGAQAETELTEFRSRELDREAAEAVGYKATVLSDLRKTKGLAMEMRDAVVEEKGKKVTKKLPHVRPSADEKAQWTPLREYAETQLKDYLPALAAEGSGPDSGRTAPSWPPQRGEERKPPLSPDDAAKEKSRSFEYQAV